jgi:hypothetical protein
MGEVEELVDGGEGGGEACGGAVEVDAAADEAAEAEDRRD